MRKLLNASVVLLMLVGCGGGDDAVGPGAADESPRPLNWSYVNRLPQPDDLLAVSEFAGRAVAVGNAATLMVYREGQFGWSRIESPTAADFRDVLMLDASRVLAVATDGVWLSEDSGFSWERVLDSTGMQKLAFNGDLAVVAGGSVAFSDDLRNWQTSTVPAGSFRALDVAFAGDLIWVLTPEALFRSDDGGNNFVQRTLRPSSSAFACLAFADAAFGVAVTRNGELFNTTDGSTFNPLRELRVEVMDIDFDSPELGVLVTVDLDIYTSDSSGKAWTRSSFLEVDQRARSVDTSGSAEFIVVGEEGLIAETSGGGSALTEISSGFWFDVDAIAFASPSLGLAIGDVPDKVLLKTLDGGFTWKSSSPPVGEPVDLAFFGEEFGLLLDRSGVIARTAGVGQVWEDTGASSPQLMDALLIFDAEIWMASGREGTIVRTADAGASWDTISAPSDGRALVGLMRFPGTNVVVGVGLNTVVRSEDAGQTWSLVDGTITTFAVAAVDGSTAIAVGDVIYRSSDRGLSWQLVQDSPEFLESVAFLDDRQGIAVGEDGLILETVDGGLTWNEIRMVGQDLYAVAVRDVQSVVVGGEDGAVLAGLPPVE